MKVLWISNLLFPEARAALNGDSSFKSSGGWLISSAKSLAEQSDIDFTIATPYSGVTKVTCVDCENFRYFLVPVDNNRNTCVIDAKPWMELDDIIKPDIVHIHGTEFPAALGYIKACPNRKFVISMQGLCLPIGENYWRGLSKNQIYSNLTIRDILSRDNIIQQGKKMLQYGYAFEQKYIQSVQHIIGRTHFDREYVQKVNPDVVYHKCNESLREAFYTGKWEYINCAPHTIFISSASYPVKGAHQLFKAMPKVIATFPDTEIRIAGNDITRWKGLDELCHYQGYGKILKKIIKEYGLTGRILFLGSLSAEEMKQEYLRSNVFVCSSTCENSPNSLGEAQILGVPCIATAVGGVPSMIESEYDGKLIDFADVSGLADSIIEIFNRRDYDYSNMVAKASARHNRENNVKKLMEIYRDIYDC